MRINALAHTDVRARTRAHARAHARTNAHAQRCAHVHRHAHTRTGTRTRTHKHKYYLQIDDNLFFMYKQAEESSLHIIGNISLLLVGENLIHANKVKLKTNILHMLFVYGNHCFCARALFVRVCICARVSACMHVYARVCMPACMYVSARVGVRACACRSACEPVLLHNSFVVYLSPCKLKVL